MKKINISDPFTGLQNEALELKNKDVFIYTPFSGVAKLEYIENEDSFKLPAYLLKPIKTYSLSETATILNVSRMRISRMCKDGVLKHAKINNTLIISYDSILEYKEKHDRYNH